MKQTLVIEIETDDMFEQSFRQDQFDDCRGAINVYTRMIEDSPGDVVYLIKRGLLHLEMSNPEAAIADLDYAIYINPDFAEAYEARAQVRMSMGNSQGAREDLVEAAELDPERMRFPALFQRLTEVLYQREHENHAA